MIFHGIIKVNKENNYAYFSIDTATVRKELQEPFTELRNSMKARGICGSLYICRFDGFDGNFDHNILIYLLIFHERTTHHTLDVLRAGQKPIC